MPRFFASPSQWSAGRITLDEAEGRHAVEVLRLRVGDAATMFDGAGREATVRLVSAGKRLVEGELVSERRTERAPVQVTLVQALPKGKLVEWIFEKATELGVSRIVPLLTERTVVHLEGAERERKREKWERSVVEACKQCGQNWLPRVEAPVTISALLQRPRMEGLFVGSLHAGAVPFKEALAAPLGGEAGAVVGPEGDFSPDEMERLVAWGARPVSLGRIVLRVETAAMYMLSVISHHA